MRETTDLHDATTNRRRTEAAARRDARMAELVAELTGGLARRAPVTPSTTSTCAIPIRWPTWPGPSSRTRLPSPLRAPAYLDAG